jgi:hypothetical protein
MSGGPSSGNRHVLQASRLRSKECANPHLDAPKSTMQPRGSASGGVKTDRAVTANYGRRVGPVLNVPANNQPLTGPRSPPPNGDGADRTC